MAKDNCRDATHLYVATVGKYSKFGISKNPKKRCLGVTQDGFGRARLVRSWHLGSMSSSVEWLVAQRTVAHRILCRIEFITLPMADLINIVEAAITEVESGGYEKAPHIKRREARLEQQN